VQFITNISILDDILLMVVGFISQLLYVFLH